MGKLRNAFAQAINSVASIAAFCKDPTGIGRIMNESLEHTGKVWQRARDRGLHL